MTTNNIIDIEKSDIQKESKKRKTIISIDGVKSLSFKWIESNSKKTIEEQVFSLEKISKEELFLKRLSGNPGFVLKVNSNLYYTDIPKKLNIVSAKFVDTKCCAYHKECSHMLAKPESCGGCKKVFDSSIEAFHNISTTEDYARCLIASKRIEKYDFILHGYESFNTKVDAFVVLDCSNYEKSIKKSSEEIESNKKAIQPKHEKVATSNEFWKSISF